MRMGAFMVGGIIGAATAIAVMRNNKQMNLSMANVGSKMNKMMDTAKHKLTELKFSPRTILSYDGDKGNSTDRVEEIIHEDPKLRHEVNDILEEHGRKNTVHQ